MQSALTAGTAAAVKFQRDLGETEAVDARRAIEAEGGEIAELTNAEHAAFAAAVAPLLDDAVIGYGAGMFDLLDTKM